MGSFQATSVTRQSQFSISKPVNPPRQMRAEYRIAEKQSDITAALRLVYKAYARQGYIKENPFELRVIPQHLSPTTEVLVAKIGERTAFTATLVFDDPTQDKSQLPLSSLYANELAEKRAQKLRMVEVSCLAHDPDNKPSLSVVVRMMALIGQCAEHRGMDLILAVVHPHHLDFYSGFFGFQLLGEVKLYPAVHDNPAVAIALDLRRLAVAHPQGHKRIFGNPFPEETLRRRPVPVEVRRYLCSLLDGYTKSASEQAAEQSVLSC